MSKIQSIANYQRKSQPSRKQMNISQRINFGKGGIDLPEKAYKDACDIILGDVEKKIDKKTGKFGWLNQKLADSKGEIQAQLINALFTTTLAPLMIAFNPFSKTDENTKKYTALRQPISAAIALSGGLAMTLGINRYMSTIYNEGYNEAIDLRPGPDKNYLKRTVKYQKGLSKSEKDQLDAYAKKIHNERVEFFKRLITEDPKNIRVDEQTKAILIGNENIQANQTLKVPNLGTQKELEGYLNKNNLHNVELRDILKNQFKFELYEDGQLKPHVTESRLSEVKAMDFLREIGLIEEGNVNENDLRKALAICFENRNLEPLKNEIFNKNALKANGAEKLQELFGKLSSRVTQMTVGEEIGKAQTISLGQFFHQLGYKATDKTLQELANKSMAEVLTELKGIFKGKLDGFDEKADLLKFAENMLKNNLKKTATNAGNHKFFIGIFFNLFITAVTCTILNWAYPRIVEKLFPELVKNNKSSISQKGGNK